MARALHTVLFTVGTSLIFPNLSGLPTADRLEAWKSKQPDADHHSLTSERIERLRQAYAGSDWRVVADTLAEFPMSTRLCGAELNSLHDLVERAYLAADCRVLLLHSDTEDGRAIANVLVNVLSHHGHDAEAQRVEGLRDDDPRAFRTHGLRNLARRLGAGIRNYQGSVCINATGGYKAQIAVAVLIGQALGVPVYYKHERFSEIIAFPPMPVAMDLDLWMRHADLFFMLDLAGTDAVPANDVGSLDERLEPLLERVAIEGTDYLELSATGQIFHEMFQNRFSREKDRLLPSPALSKRPPHIEDSGHMRSHLEIERMMTAMTNEIPFVTHCRTFYYNPDLSTRSIVRRSASGIECVVSNGSSTVKWAVETTATTPGQTDAAVAHLNDWLRSAM